MTFEKFISHENLVSLLFEKLGLLKFVKHTVRLDNYPDFDISPYAGLEVTSYYFRHSWKFKDVYYAVINADFRRYGVFNYASVEHMLESMGMPSVQRDEALESAVERAADNAGEYDDVFYDHRYESFTVKRIEVNYIDNHSKKIEYSGFFDGDSTAIEDDTVLIAELNLTIINANLTEPLYRLLLADSYLHYDNQEYNQAFFYAFVAFETYLTQFQPKGQLKQKLKRVNVKDNEIFLTVSKELQRFEDIRNSIAHGKEFVKVSASELKEFYALVIPVILYKEYNLNTYSRISRKKSKMTDAATGSRLRGGTKKENQK